MPSNVAKTTRAPRSRSGWSAERRAKHRAAIQRWKPWEKSTGPKTDDGKNRSRINAWKHGFDSRAGRRAHQALLRQREFIASVERLVA